VPDGRLAAASVRGARVCRRRCADVGEVREPKNLYLGVSVDGEK
jgi:hypothetical protein